MARSRDFDRIAWIYGLFFHYQRLALRRELKAVLRRLDLPAGAAVLDIGCGPGAYASLLGQWGNEVWAVDASPRMVATARRLLRRAGQEGLAERINLGDALEGLDFPDRRFDLVLAAHVVHGLSPLPRRRFYREARRVSRGPVLLHDYAPPGGRGPGLIVRALEALEASDYRRFRREAARELREAFTELEVRPAGPGSAWYLCRA